MSRRTYQIHEVIIAGQCVTLVRNCVRAPLCLLARIAKGGWASDCRIVAHQWNDGRTTGWWHEAEFRSAFAAAAAWQTLANHPAAVNVREHMRRQRGGRA